MIIVKRVKPGLIHLYKSISNNEIESYTLLNLTAYETMELIMLSTNLHKDKDKIVIEYEDDEPIAKYFKKLAQVHKENCPTYDIKPEDSINTIPNESKVESTTHMFKDVSKRIEVEDSIIPGTSALVRDKDLIKVVKRSTTGSKINFINKVFITNEVRNKFFDEVKKFSSYYKKTNKYGIDTSDSKLYNRWSDYINKKYLDILQKVEASK